MTSPAARHFQPATSRRLDDLLFATVLTTLAIVAGLSASAVTTKATAQPEAAVVQLPRVEIVVRREVALQALPGERS